MLLFEFFCGTPPSFLKVYRGVVVGGGGLKDFSVSPKLIETLGWA